MTDSIIFTNKNIGEPLKIVDKKVCIFCGSSSGSSPKIISASEKLGQLIGEINWGLVYGGGTRGIMGAVARNVSKYGGPVHGIIPKALMEREQDSTVISSDGLPNEKEYGKTTVVHDMHTRKRMMGQEADAFIALPGGFGTAEELFEAITWNQLGIHSCPIIVFNIDGFYDGFIQFIEKAIATGFISELNGSIVAVANTPEEVIQKIKDYKVPDGRLNLDWSAQTPKKSSE